MQQILGVWSGLDMRGKAVVVLATAGMFAAVLAMSRMAAAPHLTLLYAGLDSAAAGEVVHALEERGTRFEVRGDAIYVPSSERDALRLTLAGDGLPTTGGRGYELLDSLNGFGTTSQMFDAAYWRAKEGELARTIVASPFVAQARVHIASGSANPFRRGIRPTASVSVVPAGAEITARQADALRHLVASAVAGMAVADVAVIDANGMLIEPRGTDQPASGGDRAERLRKEVLRLVEARVGAGNAVVAVSVDTVTETESIHERRFDPETRVAISTETEERSDSSRNQAGGAVTVASNLPDGDAAAGKDSSAQGSQTRERVNYEVSETRREIVRAPGAVKRLTVAVLVNGVAAADADGAPQIRPRPREELDSLRDLVASAVGFQESRGDVITIRSMAMPPAVPLGTAAQSSSWQRLHLDVTSIVQLAVLSLVVLILGLFVLRPILARPASAAGGPVPALPPIEDTAADPPQAPGALDGEIDDGGFQPLPQFAMAGAEDGPGLPAFAAPPAGDDPVERLRSLIGERREETVEILRNWLEDSRETAE